MKGIRWLGIAVVLLGIIANQWSIGFLLSNDGRIESSFNRNLILLFQCLIISFGLVLIFASKYRQFATGMKVVWGVGYKLLIGVLLVELIFGGWFNPLNRLKNLNIPRNTVMRYDVSTLYPRNSLITYTRDQYGLRGVYPSPDSIDILTVGGSSTDQSMVSDEETWQAVLQNEFHKNNQPLSVVNAGRNGQSTIGHIKCFELWFPVIPNFKPKYILFYIGENDLNGGEWEKDSLIVKMTIVRLVSSSIRHNSFFFPSLHTLYRKFKNDHGIPANKLVDPALKTWTTLPLIQDSSYHQIMAGHLDQFAQRLNRLMDYTDSMGAKGIFVTHADRDWRFVDGRLEGVGDSALFGTVAFNGVDKFRMMQEQNRVMAQVAQERGAFFLNTGESHIWEDSDFYDLVHFTPDGCRKFGKMLYDSLNAQITTRANGYPEKH